MTFVPVVPHHQPAPVGAALARARRTATQLAVEHPALLGQGWIDRLACRRVTGGPSLHLDDLSKISLISRHYDMTFIQDRARLRAGTGDLVASCSEATEIFESYCTDTLGLGRVAWLRPRCEGNRLGVATCCWTDRRIREHLAKTIRRGELESVHPHIGTFPVWATAELLRRISGRAIAVVAPPPALTAAVNDKGWFAMLVGRLFGAHWTPHLSEAWSMATLTRLTKSLAQRTGYLVFKVPDATGGTGNVVLEAVRLRNKPLATIRQMLSRHLHGIWQRQQTRILVGIWEEQVLQSPSIQLWLPPKHQGLPVVEGVFQQALEGPAQAFRGCRPAQLPGDLLQELADRGFLLGVTLQQLGYVGRCSFDTILVGRGVGDCRIEFIECNGRWGGTSTPMTLMNRLFGDWATQPYSSRECFAPGLERRTFEELLQRFAPDLYRSASGSGSLIFYNPSGLKVRAAVSAIALGPTWDQAAQRMDRLIRDLRLWASSVEPAAVTARGSGA